MTSARPDSLSKLFTQVIMAAHPSILSLWEEGDRHISQDNLHCDEEVILRKSVGRSYYQCQPHFWQCYWQGGVIKDPSIKIDLYGQSFNVKAAPAFEAIPEFSNKARFYELVKGPRPGLNLHYGVLVKLEVEEIPGMSWPILLTDSCRDVYLPERVYNYGPKGSDFRWDNIDRKIFIDKFYVTNQQVNDWKVLTGRGDTIIKDRNRWPEPAFINKSEQIKFCSFWGKRLLEAKLLDAASMTPSDLNNPRPERILKAQTPWQRDLSKTFLGMSRVNPDYQLTPLDCQLAEVDGCPKKHLNTDSATWMGINFTLGYSPESLHNFIYPDKNLKMSSHFLPASSKWHELGLRSKWNGIQGEDGFNNIAFRCYEEVVP